MEEKMINNKIKCYDPKDNTEKETNNPALLAGQSLEYMAEVSGMGVESDFYFNLIAWANFCDEKMEKDYSYQCSQI